MLLTKTNIDNLMKPYLLQDEELKELVVKIPGWEIKNTQIQREFKFSNFVELKNLSSSICFFEILLRISLHLLD